MVNLVHGSQTQKDVAIVAAQETHVVD